MLSGLVALWHDDGVEARACSGIFLGTLPSQSTTGPAAVSLLLSNTGNRGECDRNLTESAQIHPAARISAIHGIPRGTPTAPTAVHGPDVGVTHLLQIV